MGKLLDKSIVKLLLISGAVYFFLEVLFPIFAPALLALLFLAMFGPFLKKVSNKFHINRQLGAIVILFLGLSLLIFIAWLLCSWVLGELPFLLRNANDLYIKLCDSMTELTSVIKKLTGIDVCYLENIVSNGAQKSLANLENISISGAINQTVGYFRPLIAFAGFLLVFIVTAVLLAKDYDLLMNKMLDNEDFHIFLELLCGILKYIASYVKAQLLIMAVIGTLCVVTLFVTKISFGILFGILAGVLDALPLIGTGTVLVPLSFVQIMAGEYGKAVTCIVLYIVCIIIREFLEPKLIGGKVGISPAAIIASMYGGVKLFGVVGIIKGPLGLIIIIEAYKIICRKNKL